MRKISKTRASSLDHDEMHTGLRDARPLRIPGATITSWPGSADIDIDSLIAQPLPGTTVAGAGSDSVTQNGGAPAPHAPPDRPTRGTVSLSDGTRITFVTANQFEKAD
jgi:hypothetical protein